MLAALVKLLLLKDFSSVLRGKSHGRKGVGGALVNVMRSFAIIIGMGFLCFVITFRIFKYITHIPFTFSGWGGWGMRQWQKGLCPNSPEWGYIVEIFHISLLCLTETIFSFHSSGPLFSFWVSFWQQRLVLGSIYLLPYGVEKDVKILERCLCLTPLGHTPYVPITQCTQHWGKIFSRRDGFDVILLLTFKWKMRVCCYIVFHMVKVKA